MWLLHRDPQIPVGLYSMKNKTYPSTVKILASQRKYSLMHWVPDKPTIPLFYKQKTQTFICDIHIFFQFQIHHIETDIMTDDKYRLQGDACMHIKNDQNWIQKVLHLVTQHMVMNPLTPHCTSYHLSRKERQEDEKWMIV